MKHIGQTAEQKIAANTGSFAFLADMSGSMHDMYLSSSVPFVPKGSRRPGLSSSFRTAFDMPGITDEDRAVMTFYSSQTDAYSATKVSTKLQMKKRKEASQSELREYYQGFKEAKLAEIKSWLDNEVFDLVDSRKIHSKNWMTGRWVLTIKRDKDGNFLKCKARWVLRGFQDRQKDEQQTDSPAASRSGFRMAVQQAANKHWNLFHLDLKTAFLQGEAYDSSRDIICQIPPEMGYPPYIVALMKKPAYGLNDAPRRWWSIIDAAVRKYGREPTKADRCTCVYYGQCPPTSVPSMTRVKMKSQGLDTGYEGAVEYFADPRYNNDQGRTVHGTICLHVDDLFMAGDSKFEGEVLDLRIRMIFFL